MKWLIHMFSNFRQIHYNTAGCLQAILKISRTASLFLVHPLQELPAPSLSPHLSPKHLIWAGSGTHSLGSLHANMRGGLPRQRNLTWAEERGRPQAPEFPHTSWRLRNENSRARGRLSGKWGEGQQKGEGRGRNLDPGELPYWGPPHL